MKTFIFMRLIAMVPILLTSFLAFADVKWSEGSLPHNYRREIKGRTCILTKALNRQHFWHDDLEPFNDSPNFRRATYISVGFGSVLEILKYENIYFDGLRPGVKFRVIRNTADQLHFPGYQIAYDGMILWDMRTLLDQCH